MKTSVRKLLRSPFALAAFVGLVDLSGGFISVVADLWWLAYDVLIKNGGVEFVHNTLAYSLVFGGLIIAAILLFSGLIGTVYVIKRFINSGGLDIEFTIECHHKKEVIQQEKRNRIFKR